MRFKIKGFCLLLVFILAFTALPLQVSAEENRQESKPTVSDQPTIPMRWANINRVTLSMTISSGSATCSGQIVGFSGTTNNKIR